MNSTSAVGNTSPSSSLKKPQIYAVSIAKALGTILVLIGHSEPLKALWPGLWNFMHTFRMPLFFFVSGLIINDESRFGHVSLRKYWMKYCQPYVFPYLTISLVFAGVKLAIPDSVLRPVHLESLAFDILLYPWNNPAKYLWFVYVLVVVRLLTYFLRALPKAGLLAVVIAVVAIPNPRIQLLGIISIYQYIPYFLIGCILSNRKAYLFVYMRKKLFLPIVGVAFAWVYVYGASVLLKQLNEFALGVLGLLFVISLACAFENICPKKIVSVFSKYGLEIYLLQYLFIFPLSKLLDHFGVYRFLIVCCSFSIGLIGPIVATKFVLSKNNILSYLFTGKPSRQDVLVERK